MAEMNWKYVSTPPKTIFELVNKYFIESQQKYTASVPNLREANSLLLGSDYSGESHDAPYLVYSFLITSNDAWSAWEPQRLKIRKQFFSDSRRLSFKRLNDNQRMKAFKPLLVAANQLEGLSFSVAINKKCNSLFESNYPLDLSNPVFEPYKKWKKKILEKAFIIIHFLGILVAGLSKENQDIFWFTDEDAIAANDQRVTELTNLFSWITSQYLRHNLRHLRCGTSRCDDGTRQIEDFLAIPDLIAGALSEQLSIAQNDHSSLTDIFWMHRSDYSEKSKGIIGWFSECNAPLRRLFCRIDPSKEGNADVVSWFHFNNQ